MRPPQRQILKFVLENCKKSALKHSREKPISLNLGNLSINVAEQCSYHIETSVWFNKANYWTSFYMVTIFCKMIAQNINLKGILAQNSSIVEKKMKIKILLKQLNLRGVCQEFKPCSQKISKNLFLQYLLENLPKMFNYEA